MYGERTELRWPGEQWIYNLVDAYGKVYPNLKLHATDYPTAEHLRSLIRIGNIDFEGEMEKNTEGSDFIKAKLLDDDMEPLYLQVWGGRLTQSETQPNRWEDGEKAADFNPFSQKMDKAYAQARWVPTLQNDFAARADWCIKDYKNANHPPSVFLKHAHNLTAKPNKKVKLKAKATDPDGDKLTYKWWQYEEVDTYKGKIALENAHTANAHFEMPNDIKKGETIHVILEVTDSKAIPLTRYQRVIIQCE